MRGYNDPSGDNGREPESIQPSTPGVRFRGEEQQWAATSRDPRYSGAEIIVFTSTHRARGPPGCRDGYDETTSASEHGRTKRLLSKDSPMIPMRCVSHIGEGIDDGDRP